MNQLLLVVGILAAVPPAAVWELVGQSGPLRMVYIAPGRVKDTKLLATIVDDVIHRSGGEHPLQIDIFDDREQTPTVRPYTASQKLHQRAKFNFNPANGMRRFVWVTYAPVDP